MWTHCQDAQDHTYSVLSADRQPNGGTDEKWKCFDNIISKFLLEQQIPGASVAISRNNKIVYKQGYGIAGCGRRVNPDSTFRIASISKPITAAVVLHICRQRNLSLDTPVFGKQGILKTYHTQDKRMKKISICHLLQHSAGWDRDKVGDAAFVRPQCVMQHHPDSQAYNQSLLAYALRRKLQFSPGTWHAYSNLGFLVLGLVIEEITGKPYSVVLQDFLQKLGISGITVGQRQRSDCCSVEVEYFNNREPEVVESLYPEEGLVLPQYGGMAMPSSASYGGLISDTTSLLQFLYCMETAILTSAGGKESWSKTADSDPRKSHCNSTDNSSDSELQNWLRKNVNTCSEKRLDTNTDSSGELKAVPLMSYAQAKETLRRPFYENSTAGDWYGLGWDVQDNGTTWGHTGGMEGTCGTLYRHGQSGLSWAFLLNAWAKDCDLNGVIKSGLMLTDLASEGDKPPAFPGFERVTGSSDCSPVESGAVKVVTRDKRQIILLNASEAEAGRVMAEFKLQCYYVTWLCCMTQQLGVDAKVGTSKCKECSEMQSPSPVCNASKDEKILVQRYCLILTKANFVFKDYVVLFNTPLGEFKKVWCKYKKTGCCVTFLDSFCCNSSLRFNAVFCVYAGGGDGLGKSTNFCVPQATISQKTSSTITSSQNKSFSSQSTNALEQENDVLPGETELVLAMNASEYVCFARSVVASHLILVQTVTEVNEEIWVSCVLKPKSQPWRHQPDWTEIEISIRSVTQKQRGVQKRNMLLKKTRLSADSTPCNRVTRSKGFRKSLKQNESWLQNKAHKGLEKRNSPPGFKSFETNSGSTAAKNDKDSKRLADVKDTVYWVQISPESFLTELHRQIQKGRSLSYAKFYTVSGKPYVSAVWALTSTAPFAALNKKIEKRPPEHCSRHSQDSSDEGPGLLHTSRYHRTAMSKYGLLPELTEAALKSLVLQSLSEYSEEDGSVYYAAVWFTG